MNLFILFRSAVKASMEFEEIRAKIANVAGNEQAEKDWKEANRRSEESCLSPLHFYREIQYGRMGGDE